MVSSERKHHAADVASVDLKSIVATYVEGGSELTALEHLSMRVQKAEFVAVIGPSGSGKSTLLDIVAGLIEPQSGIVSVNGHTTRAADRLGQSAYMRQRDNLLPWRTTLENASLGLEASGIDRDEATALAQAQLGLYGLSGFEKAFPAQLSGGMRQRVAFLRTMLPQKAILLLDEPFGALDSLTRSELQVWLARVWERDPRTTLLVTHDVEEAILLADRVVVLTPRPGRVAAEFVIPYARPRGRKMVIAPDFVDTRAAVLAQLGLLE